LTIAPRFPAGIGDTAIDLGLSSLTRLELKASKTNDHGGFPIESGEAHSPPRSRFIIVQRAIAQTEFEKVISSVLASVAAVRRSHARTISSSVIIRPICSTELSTE
jgi:hypothetical protein